MSAQLDIVSVGMVTAVGLDAPSSCAAMRARLDGFQETRFIGPDREWLVGAPVSLPRNWVGEKRLVHLAAGAITEALDTFPEGSNDLAVLLCLPEEGRPGRPIGDTSTLLHKIARASDLTLNGSSRVIAEGRPSGHVALDVARKVIASGKARYTIIAGVDSYLTSLAVAHYLGRRRILSPSNPNGFIPGEAAAAILCGPPSNRGFSLFGLGLARESAAIYSTQNLPLRGDGMVSAYKVALTETGIEMNRLGYRIADLIGEQFWFKQTALASIRLLRGRHEFQDLWSPAESLGNVGAASTPLMIGMAYFADAHGYAAGNPVLIEASNDSGGCGAAILGRHG